MKKLISIALAAAMLAAVSVPAMCIRDSSSGVPHLSCYILKIEENTPFFRRKYMPVSYTHLVCSVSLVMGLAAKAGTETAASIAAASAIRCV